MRLGVRLSHNQDRSLHNPRLRLVHLLPPHMMVLQMAVMPPARTSLSFIVLVLLSCCSGSIPSKLQSSLSYNYVSLIILTDALLQHGQHGNVSVSFIKPANGSVWPLGNISNHVTYVPVQLQILNMWFEGSRPRPTKSTVFQRVFNPLSPSNERVPSRCQSTARVGSGKHSLPSSIKTKSFMFCARCASKNLTLLQCDTHFSILLQQVA